MRDYYTSNPFGSAKEFLKAPLYKKYDVRKAVVKTTTAMFPFMLFAACFAFIMIPIGNFIPSLQAAMYYLSYMSIQFFGIGMACMIAYYMSGFFAGLTATVVSAYFGLFCTQIAGTPVVSGSSVIGFIGYYLIALMCAAGVEYCHRLVICVVEWMFGIFIKLIYKFVPDDDKRENILPQLRPQLKNMCLVFDSLFAMAIPGYLTFLIINYLYALPMTLFAGAVADALAGSSNIIFSGAIIGFSFGFDMGGPVSLAVFNVIFSGLLKGSALSAQLMTIYSAAMITPSWLCMLYLFVGKKQKEWPMIAYDEDLLNTGFINELFQNTRLMAMSPMVYAVREAKTVPFSYIIGTTFTGIFAALFNITNENLITGYSKTYGLLRTGTVIYTDNYDAFSGLFPPLYAGGGARVILFSFAAAAIGAVIGNIVLVVLRSILYKKRAKKGEDLFLAFGYECTKTQWVNAYKDKSFLEKKLGFKDPVFDPTVGINDDE